MTATEPEQEMVCVVLAEGEIDGLTAAIERRGWTIVRRSRPELAMAELCLRDRAERSRAAWGLAPARTAALVVAHPGRWPQWPPLLDAVRRYLPGVRIYGWSDTALEELPGGEETPSGRPEARVSSPRPPRPVEAGADLEVTADELEMLLNPGDGSGPGGARP